MKFVANAEIRNSCAIYVIHKRFMCISFVAMRSELGPGWAYADIRENGFELHKIFRVFGFTQSMRNLRNFYAVLTQHARNIRDSCVIHSRSISAEHAICKRGACVEHSRFMRDTYAIYKWSMRYSFGNNT